MSLFEVRHFQRKRRFIAAVSKSFVLAKLLFKVQISTGFTHQLRFLGHSFFRQITAPSPARESSPSPASGSSPSPAASELMLYPSILYVTFEWQVSSVQLIWGMRVPGRTVALSTSSPSESIVLIQPWPMARGPWAFYTSASFSPKDRHYAYYYRTSFNAY
jgi:hypothetical protein